MREPYRRPLLWDAALSRLMDSLTGGPFLAAVALWVGASNLQIALLAATPFLAQALQLPAVALLLRHDDRRAITAWCATAARMLWVVVGALLLAGRLSASGLVLLAAASTAFAVVATAAWNWWMRDLLPPAQLGAFFGQRLRGATVVSLVVMVAAGYAVDAAVRAGREEWGYAALFAAGGLAGLGSVAALWRTPHERPPPSAPAATAWRRIRAAARSADRRMVLGLSLTGMAVSFALPFSAVYLLRSLGFSLLEATALTALSQLAYLAGLRGWSHISDRHGDRALSLLALSVLTMALVGWALTGWRGPWLLPAVAFLHFLAGYALSGIELATNNLVLRSAPADNAAAFLATLAVLRAGAAGGAVLLSGWLWDALGTGAVLETGAWELRGFQVLCAGAAVLAGWSILFLARVRMPQQAPFLRVVRAVRREVHSMSSIGGMRTFIHAVSYAVEFMAAPFASRLPDDVEGQQP